MKRTYQKPETITFGVEIETVLLAGSQSEYADSKKHTQIGEDITSQRITSETLPSYNAWDD